MSSPVINFDVCDDIFIVNCVIPEGIGRRSPFINPRFNVEEQRNSIRNQWRNNIWCFDLQKLCESLISQLLTKEMEFNNIKEGNIRTI